MKVDSREGYIITHHGEEPEQYEATGSRKSHAHFYVALATASLAMLVLLFSSCVVDKGWAFQSWLWFFIPLMIVGAIIDEVQFKKGGDV